MWARVSPICTTQFAIWIMFQCFYWSVLCLHFWAFEMTGSMLRLFFTVKSRYLISRTQYSKRSCSFFIQTKLICCRRMPLVMLPRLRFFWSSWILRLCDVIRYVGIFKYTLTIFSRGIIKCSHFGWVSSTFPKSWWQKRRPPPHPRTYLNRIKIKRRR